MYDKEKVEVDYIREQISTEKHKQAILTAMSVLINEVASWVRRQQ